MRLGQEANYGEVMVLIRKIRDLPQTILKFIVKDLLLLDWKQMFSPSHNLRMLDVNRGTLAYSKKLRPSAHERMLSPPPKQILCTRTSWYGFGFTFGNGERFDFDQGSQNWGRIQGSYAYRLLRQDGPVEPDFWYGSQ